MQPCMSVKDLHITFCPVTAVPVCMRCMHVCPIFTAYQLTYQPPITDSTALRLQEGVVWKVWPPVATVYRMTDM